jgi:hypothetical protein
MPLRPRSQSTNSRATRSRESVRMIKFQIYRAAAALAGIAAVVVASGAGHKF